MSTTIVDRVTRQWSEPTVRLGFATLFDEIADSAAQREFEKKPLFDEYEQLRKRGFGKLLLPESVGGLGVSVPEFFRIIIDLGYADSSLAQTFRNHFSLTYQTLVNSGFDGTDGFLPAVGAGLFIGFSYTEPSRSAAGAANYALKLEPAAEGGFTITGTRLYSTGVLYSDLLLIMLSTIDGRPAIALIPADREGVERLDDWDGFGQRLTASGTHRFHGVRVAADEVIFPPAPDVPSIVTRTTFPQLFMTAIVAGIAKAARDDAIETVRGRGHNFVHGLSTHPRHDPNVATTIGEIDTLAFAAESAVLAAVDSLAAAYSDVGTDDWERSTNTAIADAARAKAVVDTLVPQATNLLFDAAGGSALRESLNLNRHWRNARGLISHNPRTYKQRILGDRLLNGTEFPAGASEIFF